MPARKLIDDVEYVAQKNARANLKLYSVNRNEKKVKKKRELKVDMMVCAAAIVVMALVYTSLEAKITTAGYEINQLKTEIAQVENTNNRMTLEIEALSSPQSIAMYAEKQAGLVKCTEGNIIYQNITAGENTGLALAASMSTTSGHVGQASVEVVADTVSHPILDGLSGILDNFKQENKEHVGQVNTGEGLIEVIK